MSRFFFSATEYVVQLKREKRSMEEEVGRLQREIESLNTTINMCQEQLPASGVHVSRQRFTVMQQTFQQYVREQTARNFKFWIFSVIVRPLFESYNNMVSTRNMEEMCQTVLMWLEQKCSLPSLRPSVLESLRELSTKTAILSDPTSISKAAAEVVGEPPVSL
jgi:MAX-like protein X